MIFRVSLFLFILFSSSVSFAEADLKIAAAASLRNPFDEIIRAFREEHRITITYGASGSLLAQLIHGAPFDMFLSADEHHPKKLVEAGLASDLFDVGIGRLVLWVPQGASIDIAKEGVAGLLHPSIRKIAIANPIHAPYGAAGVAALQHFGVYQKIQQKLVFGEDISQATHFVESAAADVGILAYSVIIGRSGRYWPIPTDTHPSLKQVGVILKKSRYPEAARTFVRFITVGKGKTILQQYGY